MVMSGRLKMIHKKFSKKISAKTIPILYKNPSVSNKFSIYSPLL